MRAVISITCLVSLLTACHSFFASARPTRVNGCPFQDNMIIITGFSSLNCEHYPCVDTGKAELQEVAFSGCGNVTCTHAGDSTLSKRSGGQVVATLPRGGHGTCALSTATETIFSCSDEKKVIVTIDINGLPSFKSQSEEQEVPSAYFNSKVDQHGCYESKLQDQSKMPNDLLHIDCEGRIEKKCLYDHSS